MERVRRFSHSEMKTFLRCRRKWYLSEFRRLGPRGYDPTGPLRSGSRVHVGLEAFYTPGKDAMEALAIAQAEDWQACVNATAEFGAEMIPDHAEQFAKDCELERAMLEGYAQWVTEEGVDANLTVVSTEETVTVSGLAFAPELVKEFDLFEVVGKLDMRVIRESDGARLFVDHKTAQSLTMALPTLQQDSQMLHYHWLESMVSSEQCDGALYNVLKKVKRTKAAKPPFFARYEVHHNDDEIEAYELRLYQIIRDIFRMEAALRAAPQSWQAHLAYPNPTRDCSWD